MAYTYNRETNSWQAGAAAPAPSPTTPPITGPGPTAPGVVGDCTAADDDRCRRDCKALGCAGGHCQQGTGKCVYNGKECSEATCGGGGNCKSTCTCSNSGTKQCSKSKCDTSTGKWDNSMCGGGLPYCGAQDDCGAVPKTCVCKTGSCKSNGKCGGGCTGDAPCNGAECVGGVWTTGKCRCGSPDKTIPGTNEKWSCLSNCMCNYEKCPNGEPAEYCASNGQCVKNPKADCDNDDLCKAASQRPDGCDCSDDDQCAHWCTDGKCGPKGDADCIAPKVYAPGGSCTKHENCCFANGWCCDGVCHSGPCTGDTDYGPAPCIACADAKDCPGGYECVTMSDGQRCCIPGEFKAKGQYKLYGYKWVLDANGQGHWAPCKVGEEGCSADLTEAGQGHLEEAMKDIGAGEYEDVSPEYKKLLADLERVQNPDVKLKDYMGANTDMGMYEERVRQLMEEMAGSPELSLLQPDQSLEDMTGDLQARIQGLMARPKGFSAEEETQLLGRMRGQIGEEYRQAEAGTKEALAGRGMLGTGLGLSELGGVRRAAAQSGAEAARDVAIENMQRKTSEEQAALGIGQQFLTGQQQFYQQQEQVDLQRQLEERGWTKDQATLATQQLEGYRDFLSKEQQLDLEAQMANAEQTWKGFDIRRAVLGDQSSWIMANKDLDLKREQYNRDMALKGAEFQVQRQLAHQQLLAEAAKFGLSIEEMEARINTERMKISQESTQTMLQYLLALIAAGSGGTT